MGILKGSLFTFGEIHTPGCVRGVTRSERDLGSNDSLVLGVKNTLRVPWLIRLGKSVWVLPCEYFTKVSSFSLQVIHAVSTFSKTRPWNLRDSQFTKVNLTKGPTSGEFLP